MQSALAKKKKEFLYYIAKVSHRWRKKSGTLFFSHCRILIGSKTTLPCHHTRDLGSRNLLIQSCNFMWGEYHRLKLYMWMKYFFVVSFLGDRSKIIKGVSIMSQGTRCFHYLMLNIWCTKENHKKKSTLVRKNFWSSNDLYRNGWK